MTVVPIIHLKLIGNQIIMLADIHFLYMFGKISAEMADDMLLRDSELSPS